MAIRPTDLQGSIVQSVQSAALSQRAEEGPRQAALAAQASFVADLTKREESIAETREAKGNRVNTSPERQPRDSPQGKKRQRHSGDPFEETVEAAAGLGEPEHLIDFTA